MLSLGVLVSGTGSNLQAILDAIAGGRLDATVRVVISNKPGVLALERAKGASVPTTCLSHKDYGTREEFDAALVRTLREASVEWVVLAGFMRLLTPTMLGAFKGRILNIHPALLPAFPGVNAQEQALAYGVKVAGCTVHLVDEGTDTGPIIAQRTVPVLDTDDAAALRARILIQEHELLVEVLGAVSEDRLEVVPRDGQRPRVRVRPA
jgi:phosphoribosylglycinamide formyltransferase-1